MKRIIGIVSLFLIIFVTGCQRITPGNIENIVSPESKKSPIEGKWKIVYPDNFNAKANQFQFTKDAALVDEVVYGEVNYKIKKVNVKDYLLYNKYGVTPGELGLLNDEALVITLTSSDTLVGDFIKINENKAVAFVQYNVYIIEKTSDKVDKNIYEGVPSGETNLETKEIKSPMNSGVLLGLKSLNNKNDYVYRTLWIASEEKKLKPIAETKDILFPRKSGFWRLKTNRVKEDNRIEDVIIAYDISRKNENEPIEDPNLSAKYREILYVCDDYISIANRWEEDNSESGDKWGNSKLQLKLTDNLSTSKGVKISEIAGSEGYRALREGKNDLLLSIKGAYEVNTGKEDENFGLIRKNGHWILRGRVNYKKDNDIHYEDFNINIIPSKELVHYDTLTQTWDNIKDKVPDAIDAYTSPNNDIALILTKTKLYIYGITNGKLDEFSMEKVNLKEGEEVIMAEWAVGSYVKAWNETFNKLKTVK